MTKMQHKHNGTHHNDLYYKHMTIVNDDSSIVIKWSSKLIDAAWGVIYDRHMFIVKKATGVVYASVVFLYCNAECHYTERQ